VAEKAQLTATEENTCKKMHANKKPRMQIEKKKKRKLRKHQHT